MLSYLSLWLTFLALIMNTGSCFEVGCFFTEDDYSELPNIDISPYNLSDMVTFTTSGDEIGTNLSSQKTVEELQHIFDERVEPEIVFDNATDMIVDSPGFHTIDQVCMIYDYLSSNWSTTGDPRGKDYFRFANETLSIGRRHGLLGAGDCDDFAILMAALVESIGGTTRIILAKNPEKGHAYCEVYLGKVGCQDKRVEKITKWIEDKYNLMKVHGHIDQETGDFWLNLDWGQNQENAAYPGCPLIIATENLPVYIRDVFKKEPINPSPLAIFSCPNEISAGEEITFNASQSNDIVEIADYLWDFGDNSRGIGENAQHTYLHGGSYVVNLTVQDTIGARAISSVIIRVVEPSRITNLSIPEFTWTTSNFEGFYYNLDKDLGLEKLVFRLSDSTPTKAVLSDQPDSNGNRGIVYTTQAQRKDFEFEPWGQYYAIGFLGEMYVAAYDDHVTENMRSVGENVAYLFDQSNNRNLMANKQICRVLMDTDSKQIITDEKPLELKEGYELAIKSIDTDSNSLDLELTKDGDIVDRKIIQPSIDNVKISDGTYLYRSNLGDTSGIVQIAVHFKNAYRESYTDKATIDGVFQVSESPISLKSGTEYDKMSIKHIDLAAMSITMDNKDNRISLTNDRDIVLMQNIYIKTADEDEYRIDSTKPLRYCLYKKYTEPGVYNIRGATTSFGSNEFAWTINNFAGFNYDIDNNIGSEQLTFKLSDIRQDNAILSDQPDLNGNRGVVYTTQAQRKNFEFEPWGKYWVIGFLADEYFVAYDANTTLEMDILGDKNPCLDGENCRRNLMAKGQIGKVLLDTDDEITFSSDDPLMLEDGYQLRIKKVDSDVNKVFVGLEKDGEEVDSKVIVIYSSDPIDNDNDKTYYYKDDLGEVRRTIHIAIHFKNLFMGSRGALATVDGIFQISDRVFEINQGSVYDMMTIKSIDACSMRITMDNEDSQIALSKGLDELLMEDIHIKVADQDIIDCSAPLRFYIFKNFAAEDPESA